MSDWSTWNWRARSKAKPDVVARLRSRAGLIVSFHDFRATRNLDETLEKMLKIPADFYKIVSTATTLSDNVTMMKFLQTQSDKHALIGLCMGEQGIISRVLERARRQRVYLWRRSTPI